MNFEKTMDCVEYALIKVGEIFEPILFIVGLAILFSIIGGVFYACIAVNSI